MSREKHDKIRDIVSNIAGFMMGMGFVILMFGEIFGFVISMVGIITILLQLKYELRYCEKHQYDDTCDNQ